MCQNDRPICKKDGRKCKGSQRKKKVKRDKARWTPRKVADMVDIVVNNEDFKRKLIFTNTPNATNSQIYEEIINCLKERSAGDQDVKPLSRVV